MSSPPLAGVRIAVTRARAQAEGLAAPLRELGADVLVAPLIRIAPSIDSEAVLGTIRQLASYDWLVLTSANGVELFVQAMQRAGVPLQALDKPRIACVGPVTTAALARHGIPAEVVPDEFVGDALAEELAAHVGARARVLLARAGGAREALPRQLAERGATVEEIELYRSVPDEEGAQLLRNRLAADALDVITFTSGSTVRYFAASVGPLKGAIGAVIGPATAEVARQHNIPVAIEANPHTARGLADAIADYFRRSDRPTEE